MSTIDSTKIEIGIRLRTERERLGFSQHLFAAKQGVNRMTQSNYESGKRSPDAEYLRNAAECGMDIGYVVTGTRSSAPDFFRLATTYVLSSIERRTGFAEDVLSFVIEALTEAALSTWLNDPEIQNAPPDRYFDMSAWIDVCSCTALLTALDENARLLRDIFGTVNGVLCDTPTSINGEKKLALVLMLFKAFKESGEVNSDVASAAVQIANM